MNIYIMVEGARTETSVYPAWLNVLAPQLRRVDNYRDITDNCYYLFSGAGIPSIYNHACNAILDIHEQNRSERRYDYLILCLDTEEGTREDLEREFKAHLEKRRITQQGIKVLIFEHKVCMKTWFLGNNYVFKQNPNTREFQECVRHYNVATENPELMPSFDAEKNKAEYHYYYLRKMFAERNMIYKKTYTCEVQKPEYLQRLINRYQSTNHIGTFGRWYEFITSLKH